MSVDDDRLPSMVDRQFSMKFVVDVIDVYVNVRILLSERFLQIDRSRLNDRFSSYVTNLRLHTKPTSIKCCRICSVSSNFCNCLFDHRCSNLIRQLTLIDEINNIRTLHQSLKTSVLSFFLTRTQKKENSVLVDRDEGKEEEEKHNSS